MTDLERAEAAEARVEELEAELRRIQNTLEHLYGTSHIRDTPYQRGRQEAFLMALDISRGFVL